MKKIQIPLGKPTPAQLKSLENACKEAFKKLKSDESEVRLPLFIEFAGSPKSGKSTIIGTIAHFFRRQKVCVAQPVEGASLRTPEPLKDDWLAFNAWSGCYALQNILVDCFLDPPVDLVLLDRGLFDIVGWMQFLATEQRRITEEDRQKVVDFFSLDLWRRRENAVFLFTADHKTSLARETDDKLCTAGGGVMNAQTLAQLQKAYTKAASDLDTAFARLYNVDTSFQNQKPLSFQMIAYQVAERIVKIIDELGTQELLMVESVQFEGFNTEPSLIEETRNAILRDEKPVFHIREEAEKSTTHQQVVPYAILKDQKGHYFRARRRAELKRKELQRKLTILVGGHAEKRDWTPSEPDSIFETCLRRELEEELVGIRVESVKPLGFISDVRNNVGSHHLAFIHEVIVGGNVKIRRQAIDKEFGREAVEWVGADEIRAHASELDPWSQLVAHKLFGAPLPPTDQLFMQDIH
ncbi:MAG: NUDIX domain-containing protein [Phycisphaerae bacterium]|nr:NUDIX domain-containing protein [Phycisphaerae bacterium]